MFINLLPQKLVIKMLIRRRLRQWALIWAALLIAGLLVMSANYRSLKQCQVQLDSYRQRVRPLASLQLQTSDIEKRLKTLHREVEVLETISAPDRSLALLAILGNAAKSPQYKVQIERMSLASTVNRVATQKPPTEPSHAMLSSVSLQGIADGDFGLANFVQSLRESNVFSQVELKSSLQYQRENLTGRQFQVECKFAE